MAVSPKLTTIAACRVADINRDRFNEHVAAGNFECAPPTVAGRARLFDPDAMLALKLFSQNLKDDMPAKRAGEVACAIALEAKLNPDEPVIALLTAVIGFTRAVKPADVPPFDRWTDTLWSGSTIRRVDYFNVAHLRAQIAHDTEEERAIIGAEDEA